MLKLTYTEDGLHLERVAAPVEVLVAQRVVLAMRAGQPLHVEPGKASFLLPQDMPGLAFLEVAVRQENSAAIAIAPVDHEFVEVSVQGSWIADTAAADEGMFVTAFSDRAEYCIHKLWQTAQSQVSYLA